MTFPERGREVVRSTPATQTRQKGKRKRDEEKGGGGRQRGEMRWETEKERRGEVINSQSSSGNGKRVRAFA